MMNRDACLQALNRVVTDEIVVPTYSAAFAWLQINQRPLNYYSFGAMGLASSHGLGFALGRPDKRVIILDGDGSLLMNLGTLVTIGGAAPKNLIHFVAWNSSYEANGAQPLPNPRVDIIAMARAAGYRHVFEFADLKVWEAEVARVIRLDGPVFGILRTEVQAGTTPPEVYGTLYEPSRRVAFRQAMQEG